MIYRKEEMASEVIEGNRGGEGKGTYTSIIPPDLLKDELKFFNLVTLEPGASIGVHPHVGNYEIYTVLQGQALIHDDGEDVACGPGDANICADGKSHGISNVGEGDLTFLACIVYENKAQ